MEKEKKDAEREKKEEERKMKEEQKKQEEEKKQLEDEAMVKYSCFFKCILPEYCPNMII